MNFKRFLSFMLALLILGTRIGFAINVHYCGHEIAKISWAQNPSDCGMEMEISKSISSEHTLSKSSCCKDQILLFQNQEPQKAEADFTIIHKSPLVWAEVTAPIFNPFQITQKFHIRNWNPPPPNYNQLLSLYQCFVFYG